MNKQVLFSIAISALKLCFFLGTLLLVLAPSTAHGQQLVAHDRVILEPGDLVRIDSLIVGRVLSGQDGS